MNLWQALLTGTLAIVAAIVTAVVTTRLQHRHDSSKWQQEVEFATAKAVAEDRHKGSALVEQLAIAFIRDHVGKKYFIAPGAQLTIGTARTSIIVLYGAAMSKGHARLYVRDGKVVISDLHTRGGTYVNGRPCSWDGETVLKDGDHFTCGLNTNFEFHYL